VSRVTDRLARAFVAGMVDVTAPGWVTAAAAEMARAIRRFCREEERRRVLGMRFVSIFADEMGIRVSFPVDVKAKVVR
jgi:hypothetical protein